MYVTVKNQYDPSKQDPSNTRSLSRSRSVWIHPYIFCQGIARYRFFQVSKCRNLKRSLRVLYLISQRYNTFTGRHCITITRNEHCRSVFLVSWDTICLKSNWIKCTLLPRSALMTTAVALEVDLRNPLQAYDLAHKKRGPLALKNRAAIIRIQK